MNNKGFTVIEFLVVVSILVIFAGIVLASLTLSRERSRDNRRVSDIQFIALAVEQYRTACREYPESLDPVASNGCPAGITLRSYLAQTPKDPSTQLSYSYFPYSVGGGSRCTHYHIWATLESDQDANRLDAQFNSSGASGGGQSIAIVPCNTQLNGNRVNGADPAIYDLHR